MEEFNNTTDQTTATSSCGCNTTSPKSKCAHTWAIICMAVMFIGLVVLYVLHFTSKPTNLSNPDATPVVAGDGVKVAFINTDTLIAKYQYAIDLQEEIVAYQSSKESSYRKQTEKFQADYNHYLQVGGDMTLSQQKSQEESLQRRMAELQNLEGEYAMQIQKKTLEETEKMTKAVYAFIREYNKANQKFDIILSKSFNSSPVLYGNPGMDITNEIVEGLNKEYAEVKAKEEKSKK